MTEVVEFHPSLHALLVPIGDVQPFPGNPRTGDTGAIVESIRANGMYQPVVAQRSTGYVLAGNHRLDALRQLGQTRIPVVYVDVDDERARRIALVDNRTSDLASYDPVLLAELLRDLDQTEDSLAGTGYDAAALAEVLAQAEAELVPATDLAPEPRLDVLDARLCQRCGYDVANNPDARDPWETDD